MMALLDTSEDLAVCEAEIGVPVQQLLTPLTRFNLQRADAPFAIDNGAYSGFRREAFESLLEKHWQDRERCLFVTAPDVVGSARRTLECYRQWSGRLSSWKRALVAQDGLEDLEIPWDCCEAIFIGGSTKWKLSSHAADVIRAAKICGHWVHAGRVNTPGRFEYFDELGCDSFDGSGLARYSWMRERIAATMQPNLLAECGS